MKISCYLLGCESGIWKQLDRVFRTQEFSGRKWCPGIGQRCSPLQASLGPEDPQFQVAHGRGWQAAASIQLQTSGLLHACLPTELMSLHSCFY